MKKYIKLISAVLLTVVICGGLCSCKQLDEMRDNRAIYGKTEETLYFRKAEYKLLPQCDDLYIEDENLGYVTEKDVPILLSDMIGKPVFFDDKALFITAERYPYGSEVWCRADIYEETVQKIENYELDSLCYWNPDFSYHYDESLMEKRYIVVPSTVAEIIRSAFAGEGIKIESMGKYEITYTTFQNCDKTTTFIDTDTMIMLNSNGSEYYLLVDKRKDGYVRYNLSKEDAQTIIQQLGLEIEYSYY